MNDLLIISPSGKLYGSERVLLDFISHTSLSFDIAVPAGSDLQESLGAIEGAFRVITYNPARLRLFYSKLFWGILKRRYKKIYVNEGAHTQYLLLLARFFRRLQVIVHIRIVEDTAPRRWKPFTRVLPANIKAVTISDYIAGLLPFHNYIIPDPFIFSSKTYCRKKNDGIVLHAGIIGRIASSKGVELLPFILEEIEKRRLGGKLMIHMYGEMGEEVDPAIQSVLRASRNIILYGYVRDSGSLYSNLDVVMHLSETEPLGRIFFEAADHELPFIGIKAGGIGETAGKYGYTLLMVEPGNRKDMACSMVDKLEMVADDYEKYAAAAGSIKKEMKKQMSVESYCSRMEEVINGKSN